MIKTAQEQSRNKKPGYTSIRCDSCQITGEQRKALALLLGILFPFAGIPNPSHFKKVIVSPDVVRTTNKLLESQDGQPRDYQGGMDVQPATAVPLVLNGTLQCFVVLHLKEVQNLTTQQYRPYNVVSSLLEELLHIHIYSSTWQRNGRLNPAPFSSPYLGDIWHICSHMQDEHLVNRMKTFLLSALPLIEQQGQLITGAVWYGGDMAEHLNQAAATFHALVQGSLIDPPPDTWKQLSNSLKRDIFEPLGRDSGFRTGNFLLPVAPPNSIGESQFYCDHVAPFWREMYAQLNRAWNSWFPDFSLSEYDSALDTNRGILVRFLRHMGVTFS